MTISIEITDEFAAIVNAAQLEQAAQQTLTQAAHTREAALTVVVTDAAAVQNLNQQYRGVDKPTDVLSFATHDGAEAEDFLLPAEETDEVDYLGDVIIAYPIAVAQAAAAGHTSQAELTLLTVHGTLHLLGYDHDTAARRAEMWQLQQTVMQSLGLGDVQPTE